MQTLLLIILCWLISALPGQAQTRVLEDFEGSVAQIAARWPGQSYCCFPNSGGPFSIVTSPVANGSQALRYNYEGSQYHNPPKGGGSAEWDYHHGDKEIWITWYSYMAPGFKTGGDESDPLLVGSVATKGLYQYMYSPSTGQTHGWVFHYFYGGKQLTLSAQGIKDARGPASSGYEPRPYDTENMWQNVQSYEQPTGQWVGYEARFKLNTPGQADGVYELYITPQGGQSFLSARYANREFVDANNSGQMPGDSYWFRQKLYRQDGLGYMYLDALRVTTTRIGLGTTPPPPGGGGSPPPPPPAPDTSLPNAPTNLTVTELWHDFKQLVATVWSWLGPASAEAATASAATNDRVTITWPEVEPGTLYELRWQHVGHPDWMPLGQVPSEQEQLVLVLDPPVACAAGQDCWRCADGRAIRDGQTGPWLSETVHGKACSQFAVTPITLPPVPDSEPVEPGPAIVTMSGDKVFIACDPTRYSKAKTTGTGTKRVITCLK